jgi:hypothetical protein
MKKIITSILFIVMAQHVFSQDEYDALRYSQPISQGTARGSAIGGALGSIGGDFGALSINPAGIGIYRKSEFAISTNFTSSKNRASYLGEINTLNDNKLCISHLGLVLTKSKTGDQYKYSEWKSFSFALGVNRLASFTNQFQYSGKNYASSIVERWADEFNRYGGINATSKKLVGNAAFGAYETFLIDRDYTVGGDTNKARSYVPYMDGIRQTKNVAEKGGMNEYVFSMGGNYQEKLMIGATVGIPTINYERTKTFNEEDISGNTNNDFKYLKYNESLVTSGAGINLKLGLIYKANKNFRAGFALHTPSRIWFNDKFTMGTESHTDSFLIANNLSTNPISKFAPDSANEFNYSQTTPYKAIASMSYLFDKYGFLTADIEAVDYSTMKYNFGDGYEDLSQSMNTLLASTYKRAINIRVGAEAKLNDFSIRAGFANYGSPSSYVNQQQIMSGGIGYRTNTWFLDATYMHSKQMSKETPYTLERSNANVQSATITNNRDNVILTFGWKFK